MQEVPEASLVKGGQGPDAPAIRQPVRATAERPRSDRGAHLGRLRTLWLAAGWAGVAGVVGLSLMPDPPSIDIEQSDKALHLVAYGGLMLWFAQVRTGLAKRQITALLLVAMGIALELAQGLSGYRWLSVADMAANTAGVALGWLAAPPRLPNAFRWASSVLDRVQPAASRTRGSIQP